MKKSWYIVLGIVVIILATVVVLKVIRSRYVPPVWGDLDLHSFQSLPGTATYIINGEPVTLVNGKAEEAIPDSTAKKVTTIFNATIDGDLNSDGKVDASVLLTQTNGGSGVFYYVAAALQTDTGYQGTNAILLGDRIAPQTTGIRRNYVIANYADRKPDEAMTATPSVGMSLYAQLKNTTLNQISTNNPMINVTSTIPFQTISSPLTVTGEAKGPWYFEASFPVQILDMNNNVLAAVPAQAQGDWMTTNFVPFTATLTFTGVSGQPGMIVFKKDNPSGLPQNEASISIPIIFQ